MKVSQIVTIDHIKSWNTGDIITIKAGTGAGKSYFIKNNLYALAKKDNKKILMLIHRTNCVNQFQQEIEADNKTDTIHIKTYQSIETLYNKHRTFDFHKYDYIVCDEFHYFMSDAAFNKTTDISLNAILSQSHAIKIFMSATGDFMKRYINNYRKLSTIDYNIPTDYNYIKSLSFFNTDKGLEDCISYCIENNLKTIIFIQSAEKAYKLYKKFKKHSLFNCSKSNKTYYKYVNKNKINDMLIHEKFNELILITTTCLDSGVNINDSELTHVVCDVKDINILIQCIGRKRIQHKGDHIYLLIKSHNNKSLGGFKKHLKGKLEKAQFLRTHTIKEYIEKYPRQHDYNDIVYDDTTEYEDKATKKINMLMYMKCLIDMAQIDLYLKYGNYGWSKFIANLFNKKEYLIMEEDNEKMQLKEYLDKIVDHKLFKDEQKELINRINLRIDGKQLKSYKKLNEALNMINLPYIILPKKSNDKRYWVISKLY